MIEIRKFIPELSSIREIYHGDMTRDKALSLVAFNNSFPSTRDVEEGVIDLITNLPKESTETFIKRLHTELDSIVMLYESGKRPYDMMDLRVLWESLLSYYKIVLKEQEENTQEAYSELIEANKSYEMTPYNGMTKDEIAVLERRVKRLEAEYRDEQTKLKDLRVEYDKLKNDMLSVPHDIFRQIYLKCLNLIITIEGYYQKPIEELKEKAEAESRYQKSDEGIKEMVEAEGCNQKPVEEIKEQVENDTSFLSLSILERVHLYCNGWLFAKMHPIEFCKIFNLHQGSEKLEVCDRQKVKVCYLLDQLRLKISNSDDRQKWLNGMLIATGIQESYFNKKYRNVASDGAGDKTKKFVEDLREILK